MSKCKEEGYITRCTLIRNKVKKDIWVTIYTTIH